nr:hypothetical protein [Agilicoccus flavus]
MAVSGGEEGDEDAERAQGAVAHGRRLEGPRARRTRHLLTELQGLPGPHRAPLDGFDPRHDLAQVLLDAGLAGGVGAAQGLQDAGDVRPVPVQEIAGVGLLRVAHHVRVDVVDVAPGEPVEHLPELRQAGKSDEEQSVVGGAGQDVEGRPDDLAVAHLDHDRLTADVRRLDATALVGHPVVAALHRADLEGVRGGEIGGAHLEAEAEVGRRPRGATPDLFHASPVPQGVVEVLVERLRHEPQAVDDVRLPGPVGTDEHGEGTQAHVARLDAAVVPELQTAHVEARGVRHARNPTGRAPQSSGAGAGGRRPWARGRG